MINNKDLKEKSTTALIHELEKIDENIFWEMINDMIKRKTNSEHLIHLYYCKNSNEVSTRVYSELPPKDAQMLTYKLLRETANALERNINASQNIAKC